MSRTSLTKQQFVKLGLASKVIPSIEKRAVQLGYTSIQDYVRWLIVNDLAGIFTFPPREMLDSDIRRARRYFKSGKGKVIGSEDEVQDDLSKI